MSVKFHRTIDEWGRTHFQAEDAFELIYSGCDLSSLHMPSENSIVEYNGWCVHFDKSSDKVPSGDPDISPDEEFQRRAADWFIPEPYSTMDVFEELLSRCETDDQRIRVAEEFIIYEERNQIVLLRLAFMLVDHFRKNNVVWGVGRGSACASYCLYLTGLHRVDSLKYGLDISEFLKP